MSDSPFRPKLQWGYSLESEHEFEHPMTAWNPGRSGVGGSDTAASGIVEAYNIRRDYVVHLRLRLTEAEIPIWDLFLDWAQDSGEPFNFWFDQDDDDTMYSVYLQSLRWEDGEDVTYERQAFQDLFIIPLSLRTELGGTFNVSWTELAVGAEGEE